MCRLKANIVLVIFFLFPSFYLRADTQTPEEIQKIRQEIEQLRQEYEQRLKQMEERLKQLETASVGISTANQNKSSNEAKSKAGPAAGTQTGLEKNQAASVINPKRYIDKQFENKTESIHQALAFEQNRRIKQRVEHVLQEFVDISGYFRAGYGRNDQGGPQTGFQAPGAMAKGRLGNEAENYGELAIGKNFYLPGAFSLSSGPRSDGTPSDPIARFQLRFSMYNPYQDYMTESATSFGLVESWAAIGNLSARQPTMKFWAGNRFYRRYDIHINDFFLYNMSGGGGGVEDIQTRAGKLAVAWIGIGSQSGIHDTPEPDPKNHAGFNKTNWDFRLYETPLPWGKGEFGIAYSRATSGNDANGVRAPKEDGLAFNFVHSSEKGNEDLFFNRFFVQYGRGAAKTFTSGFETYSTPEGTFIRPDTAGSYRFRLAENLVIQPSGHFSISPALVYQITDYKQYGGVQKWFSLGVRPVAHINHYVSLAFEPFLDRVNDKNSGTSDFLFKMTFAPQVSLGNHFMSRPAIRGFITYARWGDGFVGKVEGNDDINSRQGFTSGIQMETWW